jgi:hypothetical protein
MSVVCSQIRRNGVNYEVYNHIDECRRWYSNGILHREDGPAVEYADGDKMWYLNGQLHREDGPAVEWINGDEEWYLNGMRHREDGYAVIYRDEVEYWICGHEIPKEEMLFKYSYIIGKINTYYNNYLSDTHIYIVEAIVDKLEEEFSFLFENTLCSSYGVVS